MKTENKIFLDKNRHHYDTVTKAGYVKHLNAAEREGMVRVMREEFQPGYIADLWCPPCVFDMVKLLYQRYDAWLAAQPATDHVKANFPSHKPEADVLHQQPEIMGENTRQGSAENVEPPAPPKNEQHPPHGHHRPKRRNRGR